jgi:hypothetical protein
MPPGSQVLKFARPDRLVDPVWFAKVSVTETGFDELRRSVEAKTPMTDEVVNDPAEGLPWWKQTNVVVSKRYMTKQNTLVWVVLAKEGNGRFAFLEHAVY